MTDFALKVLEDGSLDVYLFDGELLEDESLRTPVAVSLLTDREWPDSPDGDRRGTWQDMLLANPSDRHGSWLWRLNRRRREPGVLAEARQYGEQALAWLIEDGIASAVTVTALWDERQHLQLDIEIQRPEGVARFRMAELWQKSLAKSAGAQAEDYSDDIAYLAAGFEHIYYIDYPEATL